MDTNGDSTPHENNNLLGLYILDAGLHRKYQKWIIHRKLRVRTSEREGKLSNPRGRAARAMHGENLRKFTETRATAPRASPHAVIYCRS